MLVSLSGFEEPLIGRARVPARREGVLEANGLFLVLDQGRLWASGTTDREDAIPPRAGSGSRRTATQASHRACRSVPTSTQLAPF
jgi:hypothetical protein